MGLNSDNTPSGNNSVPVYFKVDFVRLVILLQQIENNPESYAIYADLDTKALEHDCLFTNESMELLETFGLVLPARSLDSYENSFHILAGEEMTSDKYMRLSIEKILVEFNIYNIINKFEPGSQDVWNFYKDMFIFRRALNEGIGIYRYGGTKRYKNNILLHPNFIKKTAIKYRRMETDSTFKIFQRITTTYPVREDLKDISPHEGNYK